MLDQYTLDIVEWLEVLPVGSIYLAFVLIAYLENVLPPVPGDILVVFAGYLAADGILNFSAVWVMATVASVFGFMTMYYIGSKWGGGIREQRSRYWMFRYIDFKYIIRAQNWMNRWGQGVVMANRFLAGTRSGNIINGRYIPYERTPDYLKLCIQQLLMELPAIGCRMDCQRKLGNDRHLSVHLQLGYFSNYGDIYGLQT